MKKNKEAGMTDWEIIKKNFNIITESEGYDYWYELEKEALDAATRMAAEIERLKAALAERFDGLTECCATCRQLFLECDFLNEALPDVCLNKMLCPEWQPREEKE
jgi:hypothetical protein